MKSSGILMLIFTLFLLYRSLIGSSNFRNAIICSGDPKRSLLAAYFFEQSLNVKKKPLVVYKAGVNSFLKLRNPYLTLHYLYMLDSTPCANFAHSNGFIGLNLFNIGNVWESLPYLKRETDNYPINIGGWHNLKRAQLSLNQRLEAIESHKHILQALELKGLSEKHIPLLLEYPLYDMRPYMIPTDSLRNP